MTRTFYVEVTCRASGSHAEELEEHLEQVMDALQDEPGVADADIGADLDEMLVDFCLHVRADSAADAVAQAHTVVRSALHAAGAATPGWEHMDRALASEEAVSTVRPAGLTPA
ncbi:hypothetical protein DFQ14_11051 [Halopolyspora algeriensis]|uniref:Uncharacterized protein n=1 Tax=Halopolyspora algeriensis TaxID=1500506 RepID=A0A368VJ20_9ACTN|nr:hypothetical protein [Halopolyspora algeriensis]RCW40725.1 hypothetical protein DFQ14_11051 [Halopolyspora algeriensis]TQM53353.1 hypothetical protein FHU43_2747 [Halopolyspora algeriensis]